MMMKRVFVLVPIEIVLNDDRAMIVVPPTLDDVNAAYEEMGGYDRKDIALHDLTHSELPNGRLV
jgi:hypothetical protein